MDQRNFDPPPRRGPDPPTNDNDAPRPPPWVLRAPLPVSVDALGAALRTIEAYDASGTFIAHMRMPPSLPPIYRREWAELVPYHATKLAMIDRGFRAAVEKCRDIESVLEASAALDAAEGRYIAYRIRILRRCYAIRDGLLQRAKLGPAMAAAAAARAVARPCQVWVCHQERSPACHDLEDPPPPRGRPRAALELGYSSEGSGGANDRCGVAVTDLGHPTEGPGGANNRYGVAASDLGPPAEGTGTGNTLPGGITIGGDNAGDLGDGVGNGGASWGGGTDLGGGQLTALLQGGHQVMGTTGPGGGPHGLGRGIPWLDKRGRVTAWLNPRLERVIPYEPHLLSPRESECAPTDFRGGKDPG